MHGFPQYTRSDKQGNLGVSIVSRIVDEQFGWLLVYESTLHAACRDRRLTE